jgi:hypothetical protein
MLNTGNKLMTMKHVVLYVRKSGKRLLLEDRKGWKDQVMGYATSRLTVTSSTKSATFQ